MPSDHSGHLRGRFGKFDFWGCLCDYPCDYLVVWELSQGSRRGCRGVVAGVVAPFLRQPLATTEVVAREISVVAREELRQPR